MNGQLFASFSACEWSTSTWQWKVFDVPGYLLNSGANDFALRGSCDSCPEGLYVGVDTHSPGTYTDIDQDGSHPGGEAFWFAQVAGPKDLETLERYMSTVVRLPNGQVQVEYLQEAFVYYSPEKLDSVYVAQRELPDGTRLYLASNLRFEKRAEYSNQAKVAGWTHRVFDATQMTSANQGSTAPVNGQFYTWFRTEWSSMTQSPSGTVTRQSGRYMQLLPSDPGSASDKDGAQNPPPFGADSDPESGWGIKFKLSMEAYAKTCESKSYVHFWQSGNSHPHDCFRVGIHAWDLDERSKSFADAKGFQADMEDWLAPLLQGMQVSDWVKKSLKLSFQGPSVSWIYAMAQSGDLMSINVNELDYAFLGGAAFTVLSIIPPVIGWQLPFDPQVPGHWLLWNGAWNFNWQQDLIG